MMTTRGEGHPLMTIGTGVRNQPPDVSARSQCHGEVVTVSATFYESSEV